MSEIKIQEGLIDFKYGSESFQTWFKVVGNLKQPDRRPLVLLHGGPGVAHQQMLSMTDLATQFQIPVIFYDQIGIGKSSRPQKSPGGKPKEFWTPELFMDELENLLLHFGIQDNFDLLGYSWGGMFGSQWVTTRPDKAKGMKHLVLSSVPASIPLWEKSVQALMKGLPEETYNTILKNDKAETFQDKEYLAAIDAFYAKHLSRVGFPKEFDGMMDDPTVFQTMNGPSEMHNEGNMKNWSVIPHLKSHPISVPTLLINGCYDQSNDESMIPFFNNIQKVKWVTFAEGSHMCHYEERERYMKVVSGFLLEC